MLSEDGTTAATFTYDPYGNIISKSYTNSGANASYSNLYYRGYYYDRDLELYYLNSRYYDANTGRFVNADKFVSTGQGIEGYNMFAYCGNNPINRIDASGEWWIFAAIVTIFCVVTLSSCSSDEPRKDLANASDLDVFTAGSLTYNCYGNAIGKKIVTNPTGYQKGDSTRETFEAVKNDLGRDNVRELDSIDAPIGADEYRVALKCGPEDYHFIRQYNNNIWYNKSGTTTGCFVYQSVVESAVWYAMYRTKYGVIRDSSIYYDDETIYFAVKVGWDE